MLEDRPSFAPLGTVLRRPCRCLRYCPTCALQLVLHLYGMTLPRMRLYRPDYVVKKWPNILDNLPTQECDIRVEDAHGVLLVGFALPEVVPATVGPFPSLPT